MIRSGYGRPDAGNGLQLLGGRGVDVYKHAHGRDLLRSCALGLYRIALLLGAVRAEGQIQHGGEEGQRHERQKEICASAFFLPFHG